MAEKIIDGVTFHSTPLKGMRSLRLFNRLGRAIGPALTKAFDGVQPDSGLEGMSVGSLSDAVQLLFDNLTDDELESLTRELFCQTSVTFNGSHGPLFGPGGRFDEVFSQNLPLYFKATIYVIQENYGNFLEIARQLLPAQQVTGVERKSEDSPAIKKSAGQPGD